MSTEVLYKARPSLWRSHPFGALIAWLLVLAGAVVAILGSVPLVPPEVLATVPKEIDIRWLGYALLAIGLLQLLRWWVASLMDQLEIREHELVWTHGLLSREYTEINMAWIRTVRVEQSLWQRIVGAGNLTVFTSGDHPDLSIRGLPHPRTIREHIKRQTPSDD